MTELELLAPARDALIAREAILHGADAVYIGGPSHGARAAAGNSIDDIAYLCDFAHTYGVRVYVTLNTIVYDSEIRAVEDTVRRLYHAGVDALIVQDLGILRMDIPPIDLHASTQCDIRTPQKAAMLAACGFSQLVLPREFSLDEIRAMRDSVGAGTALEAFVHGALCVSYSGDCQASCAVTGRSANRGECAQICRLPFTLTDGKGNIIVRDRHLLSLRDLNRIADLGALADAGISSFKIEGRLKDTSYVKTTVAAYRQALDTLIADNPRRYRRSSFGLSACTFSPDLDKAFNRGFTRYFLGGTPTPDTRMANFDTPKWVGEKVGTVTGGDGVAIVADTDVTLNNGDGIGYFTPDRRYAGFRLNRVDGNRLYPAQRLSLPRGTVLYRNSDAATETLLAKDTADRRIPVTATLRAAGATLYLDLAADNGTHITESADCALQLARSPQTDQRRRVISKLGDTPFSLSDFDDRVDDMAFIPASVLTDLRRRACDLLLGAIKSTHPYRYRRPEDMSAVTPETLTYHDNVANDKAADFYRSHGSRDIQPAFEVAKPSGGDTVVMTTRYCLRREMGCCLRTPRGRELPSPLFLNHGKTRLRLDFDCSACRMHLLKE